MFIYRAVRWLLFLSRVHSQIEKYISVTRDTND